MKYTWKFWHNSNSYLELCHIQMMKEDHQLFPISKDVAITPVIEGTQIIMMKK